MHMICLQRNHPSLNQPGCCWCHVSTMSFICSQCIAEGHCGWRYHHPAGQFSAPTAVGFYYLKNWCQQDNTGSPSDWFNSQLTFSPPSLKRVVRPVGLGSVPLHHDTCKNISYASLKYLWLYLTQVVISFWKMLQVLLEQLWWQNLMHKALYHNIKCPKFFDVPTLLKHYLDDTKTCSILLKI